METRKVAVYLAVLMILSIFTAISSGGAYEIDKEKTRVVFMKTPLHFIPNRGQVNDKARFYAKAFEYTLWVTKGGLVFDSGRKIGGRGSISKKEEAKIKRDVSRLLFVNANNEPEMISVKAASLKVNYLIGSDRSSWHCNIPTSQAVLYKNLYEGIDLN